MRAGARHFHAVHRAGEHLIGQHGAEDAGHWRSGGCRPGRVARDQQRGDLALDVGRVRDSVGDEGAEHLALASAEIEDRLAHRAAGPACARRRHRVALLIGVLEAGEWQEFIEKLLLTARGIFALQRPHGELDHRERPAALKDRVGAALRLARVARLRPLGVDGERRFTIQFHACAGKLGEPRGQPFAQPRAAGIGAFWRSVAEPAAE